MSQVTYPTARVVPISLSVTDGPLYDILKRYKYDSGSTSHMRTKIIAATIARFYDSHASCLVRLAGREFDIVTTIPSTQPPPVRAIHPFNAAVAMIGSLREMYRPTALERGEGDIAHRHAVDDAFQTRGSMTGHSVLLLDDTFVSGAHVQSAASTLRLAGATSVVALVVCRIIKPAYGPNTRRIWQWASTQRFRFDRCCICTDRDDEVMFPQ